MRKNTFIELLVENVEKLSIADRMAKGMGKSGKSPPLKLHRALYTYNGPLLNEEQGSRNGKIAKVCKMEFYQLFSPL